MHNQTDNITLKRTGYKGRAVLQGKGGLKIKKRASAMPGVMDHLSQP